MKIDISSGFRNSNNYFFFLETNNEECLEKAMSLCYLYQIRLLKSKYNFQAINSMED